MGKGSVSKHDADCIRRGDNKPTSLCTCEMTDEQVRAARAHLHVQGARQEPCPFCGKNHDPGPVGVEGGPFAGIEIKTCSEIPDEHVYIDGEYKQGPRGALLRIPPERQ